MRLGHHFPKRPLQLLRFALQPRDCGRADSAGGHVDDSLKTDRIERVMDDAQVGEDILDLSPIVESETAHDSVGRGEVEKDLFEYTGLGVRAVEDREVGMLA